MRFATHNTLLLACTRVGRLRVATSTAVCCAAAGQTAEAAPRIEVERKFQAPEGGVTPAVLAAGGTFLGEKRFSDAYWDTPECDLTRTDTWLRVRRMQADHEGQWELKLPVRLPCREALMPFRLQIAPPPRGCWVRGRRCSLAHRLLPRVSEPFSLAACYFCGARV